MFRDFSEINVGIYMMSAALFSIAFHSFFANLTVWPNLYFAQVIIISSNIYIVVNWIIALIGFNNKNVYKSKLALILWIIYIFHWLGAVILSMTVNGKPFVCSGCRCPESMWLFNNPGHNYLSSASNDDYPLDYGYSIKPVTAYTTVADDYDAKKNQELWDVESTEPSNNYPKGGDVDQVTTARMKNDDDVAWMTEQTTNSHLNVPPDGSISKKKSSHTHPKRSLAQNFFVVLVFIFMFGILTYGWLVLFSSCNIKYVARGNK